jgi:N-acetylglucosaminyldiphosphoundecaprenol N-acetyl-beta-D-mannosaminyltransferase
VTELIHFTPPRVNVLGVGISVTNMVDAVNQILAWIEENKSNYICVTGVHGVMECQRNEKLKEVHNSSGLTVPDGMPLVWAARIHGFPQVDRVYGPDLLLEVCKTAVRKKITHFLYGGDIGVAEDLRAFLTAQYPGIKIVGAFTPPFRRLNLDEEVQLTETVNRLRPDIIWVGLSTPKQEQFMAEYLPKLNTKVMIGVGAAFDVHTGRIKDAPSWIKKSGLQWLHRLVQEPRRLGKRYLHNNPLFVCKFFKEHIKNRFLRV